MQTKEILTALLKAAGPSVVTGLTVVGSVGLLNDVQRYNKVDCYIGKNFMVTGPLFVGISLLSLSFWAYHHYKNRNPDSEQQELLSQNGPRPYYRS